MSGTDARDGGPLQARGGAVPEGRRAGRPSSRAGPRTRSLLWMLSCVSLTACASGAETETWDWGVPPNFPTPRVPADNPMNAAKVELGRRLFYDSALSANRTQSCSSCHLQERAFTEDRARSIGSTGEVHPRNSMSLVNVGYVSRLTWANPLLDSLPEQALIPLFGEAPVELGMAGREGELVERLEADARYAALFADAFLEDTDPVSVRNVVRALAAFQLTLISHRSPYDDLVYRGDEGALSASARRGADLFFGERLECFHCHGGFNFSDSVEREGTVLQEFAFHNTGLYNVDGRGSYPEDNRGVMEITLDPRDMGRFRAPSLRNVELTAPYFHDGSAATLEDVIAHYEAGGRTIEAGPYAGVGAESPLKSIFVRGFELTAEERDDLVAFLRSLTDRALVNDPRFGSPFLE